MKSVSARDAELLLKDDVQIWSELKNGNDQVLNFLFYKYYNDLYFYGTKLINDNNLIIDTIQDVFLNLWEGRKNLSDVEHIKAYLFKVFRNRLLKAPAKKIILFSLKDGGNVPDKAFIISHEDILIEEETKAQISKTIVAVLEELSDKQKEILYLRFYCNLSNTEISQALSIRKQSVSNLLNRSIVVFRKKIKNFDLSIFLTFQILVNHL